MFKLKEMHFTPNWLTLWKEFASIWSISVVSMSMALASDMINCSKESKKQNSKYVFVRSDISL